MNKFIGTGVANNIKLSSFLTVAKTTAVESELTIKTKEALIDDTTVSDKKTFSSLKTRILINSIPSTLPTFKTVNGVSLIGNEELIIPLVKGKNVNLTGDVTTFVNSTVEYTITDYDVFGVYTATIDKGTVVINEDKVTVTTSRTTGGVYKLTVKRDGVDNVFNINVALSGIDKPTILTPTNLTTGITFVPTFTTSALVYKGLSQTHNSTTLELSTDISFTTISNSVINTSGDKTTTTLSTPLEPNTTYFARVKYTGNLSSSVYSDPVQLSTADIGGFLTTIGGVNYDAFSSVVVNSNKTYVAVGREDSSNVNGKTSPFISCFNDTGNVLWQKSLSGTTNSDFYCVDKDSLGNYIAVGSELTIDNNAEPLIAKFDSSGNLLWVKKLTGSRSDIFNGVAVDSNNNYFAVGRDMSTVNTCQNGLVIKFDSNGNILATKSFGNTKITNFSAITVTSDNNLIIVGDTTVGVTNGDAIILKLDNSLNSVWQKRLNLDPTEDSFFGVTIDSNSNILAVGYSKGFSGTNPDALIVKFDSSGTIIWQQILGGTGVDLFKGVSSTSLNEYIAVGMERSSTTDDTNTAIVAKFDTNGTLLWQRRLSGGSDKLFSSVKVNSDGKLILVGGEYSTKGNSSAVITRLPSDGNFSIGVLANLTQLTFSDSNLAVNSTNLVSTAVTLPSDASSLVLENSTLTSNSTNLISTKSLF